MTRPVGKGVVLMDETGLADGTTNGDAFALPSKKTDEVVAQIDIASATTVDVMIQGRMGADAAWVDLLDAVQDETVLNQIYALAYVPEMRAVVTNATGTPNVRVEIFAG